MSIVMHGQLLKSMDTNHDRACHEGSNHGCIADWTASVFDCVWMWLYLVSEHLRRMFGCETDMEIVSIRLRMLSACYDQILKHEP